MQQLIEDEEKFIKLQLRMGERKTVQIINDKKKLKNLILQKEYLDEIERERKSRAQRNMIYRALNDKLMKQKLKMMAP